MLEEYGFVIHTLDDECLIFDLSQCWLTTQGMLLQPIHHAQEPSWVMICYFALEICPQHIRHETQAGESPGSPTGGIL